MSFVVVVAAELGFVRAEDQRVRHTHCHRQRGSQRRHNHGLRSLCVPECGGRRLVRVADRTSTCEAAVGIPARAPGRRNAHRIVVEMARAPPSALAVGLEEANTDGGSVLLDSLSQRRCCKDLPTRIGWSRSEIVPAAVDVVVVQVEGRSALMRC